MKTTTIILFLFTSIFASDVNNDIAYGLVMQKLDGALPETFVIGRDGTIVKKYTGPVTKMELEVLLNGLLSK